MKKKHRFLKWLTTIVKPCIHYSTTKSVKKEQVVCRYDNSRRNYCKTVSCPHFQPTVRYRIAKHFGMVK